MWNALRAVYPRSLEGTVTEGVSAEFYKSLRDLTGAGRNLPFEIGMSWATAPGSPTDGTISFPSGSAATFQRAAKDLEEPRYSAKLCEEAM